MTTPQATDLPQPARICDGLIRAGTERPDAMAVVCGSRRTTYGALLNRVQRLATVLRDAGLEPGKRAAILSQNSDRYIEFYFAAIWAGGIMVPLNHRLSPPELAHLVEDCSPSLLVYDDAHSAKAQQLAENTSTLTLIRAGETPGAGVDYEAALASAAPSPDLSGAETDTALIVYTGGTTGKPRGVMLSHRNIVSNSVSTIPYLQLDTFTTQLHVGPFFHLGAGQRIFSATDAGATHVVLEKFSVESVLKTIEDEKVTATVLVPTMMRRILEHPDLDTYNLESLRYVSYGAAPMPPAVLKAFMQRFDACVVCQSYGQTECSPVATSLEHDDHLQSGPFGDKSTTVGRAVANVTIAIVDADGEAVQPNHVGEITVAGPNVMLGYWKNPEATTKALRHGRLHTGDLGYMDADGFVTLVDRLKDMVISGGENVYSVEVERVLSLHDEIVAAAVIGVADPDLGERVHAVVVRSPESTLDAQGIQAHCRAHLAGYKVPRSIDFITDSLPLTSTNKIDKKALKGRYA